MSSFDSCGCQSGSRSGKFIIAAVLAGLLILLIVILFAAAPVTGIQAQLTDSPGALIADGAPVLFDAVLNNTNPSAITYVPATGTFTLNAPGTYLITWWVSADGTAGPAEVDFAIEINGGSPILGSMHTVSGQVNGTALITITTPTAITLVNVTGDAVDFGANPVQANITITQV